jgi:hypothetical protein
MFLILLFPALVMQGSMAQSLYTYKAGLANSPPNWGNIQGIPNNQCGGSNQSPIDIVTRSANYVSKPCDKYMDYKFMVCLFCSHSFLDVFVVYFLILICPEERKLHI